MEPLPNRRGNRLVRGDYPAGRGASMEPLPNRRGNKDVARHLLGLSPLQWSPFRIEGETLRLAGLARLAEDASMEPLPNRRGN